MRASANMITCARGVMFETLYTRASTGVVSLQRGGFLRSREDCPDRVFVTPHRSPRITFLSSHVSSRSSRGPKSHVVPSWCGRVGVNTSGLEANLREPGSPIALLGALQFVSGFKQRARGADRAPVYTGGYGRDVNTHATVKFGHVPWPVVALRRFGLPKAARCSPLCPFSVDNKNAAHGSPQMP